MKHQIIRLIFTLLISSYIINSSYAQKADNILWQSIGIHKTWNDKLSSTVKPILRLNENLSNYQNLSFDFLLSYKVDEHWKLQILNRTWLVPDANDRQFVWFDLVRNDNIQALNIRLQNTLKFHWGLDVFDNNEADFLRWRPVMTLLLKGKIKPFVAIEPFYQFNGKNELAVMRYEAGVNWRFAKNGSFALMYRRQNSVHREPVNNENHIVSSLLFFLN